MTVYFCIDKVSSSFEKTELENLTRRFKKVVLVTYDQNCNSLNIDNLKVKVLNFNEYNSIKYFLKSISFAALFIKELIASKKYFLNFRLYKIEISSFVRSIYIANQLKKIIAIESPKGEKSLIYSFWFNQFATVSSLLKLDKTLDLLTIARAHGTDLYEERVPKTQRIAFRKFQLENTDRICSVSEKGSRYLKNKYPDFSEKIWTNRLGTNEEGLNPFNRNEFFTIVSCAKVRNIKRIHLIPEILMHIDIPIRWIHIGAESKNDPTLPIFHDNLKKLSSTKNNIKVDLLGDVSNEQVFDLYRSTSINLFISVSETEGLPVSMMEAISFGIPIIATDVGGCNEIVTEKTGILIPMNFDSQLVANQLTEFLNSEKNSTDFRKGVKEFWKLNYQNELNFSNFIGSL